MEDDVGDTTIEDCLPHNEFMSAHLSRNGFTLSSAKYPALLIFKDEETKISSMGFDPRLYVEGKLEPCFDIIAGTRFLFLNGSRNFSLVISSFQSPLIINWLPSSNQLSI